jgi:hypothetical protein
MVRLLVAKNSSEYDKQIEYASIIQKLQRELDLEVSVFHNQQIVEETLAD